MSSAQCLSRATATGSWCGAVLVVGGHILLELSRAAATCGWWDVSLELSRAAAEGSWWDVAFVGVLFDLALLDAGFLIWRH